MRIETHIEYIFRCSPKMLYSRLSTPGGLSEWFADDVKVESANQYTFVWHDWSAKARLSSKRENKYVRFEWADHSSAVPHFFEMRILVHELTNETALEIIDYAEHDNKEDAIQMWDAHINELKRLLGQ